MVPSQCDDLSRLGVPGAVDHAVCSLAHAVHLLELGNVPVIGIDTLLFVEIRINIKCQQ